MSDRVQVLGIGLDRVDLEAATGRLRGFLTDGRPHLVVTLNPEMAMRAQRDPDLRTALKEAHLVVADGTGIVWAARRLGRPLPGRVPGVDLVDRLLAHGRKDGLRVFLLGARPGVAERAAERLESSGSGLVVVGTHHGYFPPSAEDEVVAQVSRTRPDLLLCGMGSPRQEILLARHLDRLAVPVCIGVGGAIDVLAGSVSRAPAWVQRAGLEWAYRVLRQPTRAPRLAGLARFVWAVLRAGRDAGHVG